MTAETTELLRTCSRTQTLLSAFGGSVSLVAETKGMKGLDSGCDQCGNELGGAILEIDGESWCHQCAGSENTRRLRERKPPLVR